MASEFGPEIEELVNRGRRQERKELEAGRRDPG